MRDRSITQDNIDVMHEQQYHDLAGPAGVAMADAAKTAGVSVQVFRYHLFKAIDKFKRNPALRELWED